MPYGTEGKQDWRTVKQGGASKVKVGDKYYAWDDSSMSYKDSGSMTTHRPTGSYAGGETTTTYTPPSDALSYAEIINPSTDMSSMETYAGTSLTSGGAMEGYTYTGGEFDPTSGEFIEAAKSGSTTDILQGFGIGSEYYKYFDDPDLEQLGLLKEGHGLRMDALKSQAGGAFGQALAQGQQKISSMGFATHGGIESAIQATTGGVWNEYRTQQASLDIDKKSDIRQFWKAEEDDFYSTLEDVETKIDAEGGGGGGGTCVLSTAAYYQDLITKEQMMSFVNWRLKTQHKEFLSGPKWLGYQITYAPISRLMRKYKWVARIVKKLVLDKWIGVISGKKAPITKFLVEWIGLIGFVFNYKRAMKLGEKLMANPKAILKEYKEIIRLKEKSNGTR